MTRIVVLGVDTDAGKSVFCRLWLTAFPDFAYWKPVETGPSDTELVRAAAPHALIHPSAARFEMADAPPLAARAEGAAVPEPWALRAKLPDSLPLLIESFGGPFSPLTDTRLQADFLRLLPARRVLVCPSTLGAVTRTLQTLKALAVEGLSAHAVVLSGPEAPFALEQLRQHGDVPAFGLQPPAEWSPVGFAAAAQRQRPTLSALRAALENSPRIAARADDLVARDAATVWHPYAPLRLPTPPLPVVAAEEEFLILADDRRLIDGISSWWSILHGHRTPRLVSALRQAADRLDQVQFAGVTHAPAVELAEALLATTPWGAGRVFYSDNGSTAVEAALKLAHLWWRRRGEPQRTLFVGCEHGYHGDTFGAMAVGRDPLFFGDFEPLLFRALRTPLDPDRLDALLAEHPREVAAVILEPLLQAAGGMRTHAPETLREFFAVARRHGVLTIADEVMTGSRLGQPWACGRAGVVPDLICAGKTLAGGLLPLAATLVSPRVAEAFADDGPERAFFHGHTFTAHPLACAVAVENHRIIAETAALAAADRMEAFFRTALAPLAERPNVKEVRCLGSMAAVELALPGGYLAEAGPRMRAAALAEGVLLRPLGSVVYALPPLGCSADSLRRLAAALHAAVSVTSRTH